MDADPRRITRREAIQRVGWLLGGSISAPAILGVLAGCGRGTADGDGVAWALSPGEHEMVAVIAEHILPETDTPGARSLGVPEFIERMLAGFYPAEEQTGFVDGLRALDERSLREHGDRFLDCAPDAQRRLLAALDREAFASAPAAPRPVPPDVDALTEGGSPPDPAAASAPRWISGEVRPARSPVPFFRTIKELTLLGYYTSEAGATRELRHEAVPGRYDGCVPFDQVGRTWAV